MTFVHKIFFATRNALCLDLHFVLAVLSIDFDIRMISSCVLNNATPSLDRCSVESTADFVESKGASSAMTAKTRMMQLDYRFLTDFLKESIFT